MSEIHRDAVSLDNGIHSSWFAIFSPKTELAISLAAGSSKDSQIVGGFPALAILKLTL
jgi:hypothetical protein